jgi:hypothetical protein
MKFNMSKKLTQPKVEPCSDCPIPPRFVFNYLPGEDGELDRCGVECRECGDSWTEFLDEE